MNHLKIAEQVVKSCCQPSPCPSYRKRDATIAVYDLKHEFKELLLNIVRDIHGSNFSDSVKVDDVVDFVPDNIMKKIVDTLNSRVEEIKSSQVY